MLKQVLLPSKGKYFLSIPSSNGTNPPLRLLAAYQGAYPNSMPEYIVQAPEREMWIAANATNNGYFTIHSADFKRHTQFTWRSAKNKQTHLGRPLPAWARYPAGVIVKLCADGVDIKGIDAVVLGTEAKGPRYDFSTGLAFATLWHEITQKSYQVEGLIQLVDNIRRTYVE
jgi:hypothetical protein